MAGSDQQWQEVVGVALTIIVADCTFCRHQIADGTPPRAIHVARLLDRLLEG